MYNSNNVYGIIVDGLLWVRGKDVATILEYANTTTALRDHVEKQLIKLEELVRNESLRT